MVLKRILGSEPLDYICSADSSRDGASMHRILNRLRKIKQDIKYVQKKMLWRKINSHNMTELNSDVDISFIEVGANTYGPINASISCDNSYLKIGNYCSIAPDVMFLVSAEHPLNHISTYPFRVFVMQEAYEPMNCGDIVVDDDVWIGYGAKILSGVHIGQGAVIAAGAVVTKDIPPYAIAGGVPARIIKYRFEPELVEELLKKDFSKLNDALISENIENLYKKLDDKSQIEWIPNKEEYFYENNAEQNG